MSDAQRPARPAAPRRCPLPRDAAAAQQPAGGDAAGGEATGYGQLAGFRFDSYTPAKAVVTVVTRAAAGGLQANQLTVVWDARAPGAGGDWELKLPDDGSQSAPATPLMSLSGYARWHAV